MSSVSLVLIDKILQTCRHCRSLILRCTIDFYARKETDCV